MTNIRKQRGYEWEINVCKIFEKLGFVVERLGGTTTKLPDLTAHKDDSKLIIGIECKSISDNSSITVPAEQLQRCIDETEKWGLYESKMVILAFRFGKYLTKRTYLKIWNFKYPVSNVSCNYDGMCRSNGKVIQLEAFV